ncbi:MAG: hypothetical protein ACFFCF_12295, partial [Promethearchaeota archaeon]
MYAVTVGMMLFFALCETWIVTIWQPDIYLSDLEDAVAKFFAFPYTVSVYRYQFFEVYESLIIDIRFGHIQLFSLESPEVTISSAEKVFLFAQTRMIAFYIIFSFHLIVILIFLLI